VVPFTLLVPVVGMTTAWLVLGEVPSTAEVGGGLLLLAGVAVAVLPPGRRGATPGQRRWHAQRRDVAFAGDLADGRTATRAAGAGTLALGDGDEGRLAGARTAPDLDAGTRP
jgi:O-acetylserine/cysteine efflux transporter